MASREAAGTTLLEVLVALAVSLLLAGALLTGLAGLQKGTREMKTRMDQDENLFLAPLLLSRWVGPAGNHRWKQPWEGYQLSGERVELQSDLDGPKGFPDGRLDHSFERMSLRADGQLWIRSGSGRSQPLLRHIASLEAWQEEELLLGLRLSTLYSEPAGFRRPTAEKAEVLFFLWNYRPQLLLEELP